MDDNEIMPQSGMVPSTLGLKEVFAWIYSLLPRWLYWQPGLYCR